MKNIKLLAGALMACAALIVSCVPETKPDVPEKVEVKELTLSKTELTIEIGETETITATVLPSNATEKTVAWTSSNASVAEVSAAGVVTAKAEGEAVITATCGTKTATSKVTVVKPAIVLTGDASYITWTGATLSFKVRLDKAGKFTTYDAGITMSKKDGDLAPGTTEFADLVIEKDKDGNPDKSGEYLVSARSLEANSTYYYRAWAKFDGQVVYGDKKTFDSATLTIETGKMVDLGLSVKWAGYNVGATKPEEFGDYFAWGMTKPSSNGYYTWAEYDFGGSAVLYKYLTDSKYGTPDGRTTLMACDDAANVNWGENWRMPTVNEKREFLMNTTNTPYTYNGVPGFIFTSKVNGKSIFIPNAGVIIGSEKREVGVQCGFWTSELRESDNRYAHIASNRMDDTQLFQNAGFDMDATGSAAFNLSSGRMYGRSVRAVYGDPIPAEPYILKTNAATEITSVSAKVTMEMTPEGAASEKGIVYGMYEPGNTAEPLPGLGHKASVDASGVAILKGLAANYLVKARAYAYIDGKLYLGNTVTFTTPAMTGIAVSDPVSDITHESAVLNGKIGDLGYIKSHYSNIETGICWRTTYPGYASAPGISGTEVVLTPDASGNISTTITGLTRYTEYYYRAYVKLENTYFYGEIVTFRTLDEPVPDFVDLGLSVLWAGKNLGAATADLRGTQVAWGETTGKESYNGLNYKYAGNPEPTKYNSTDGKTILDAEDDAATAALGTGVRTPSPAEFKELMDNVTTSFEKYNGTTVMMLTSKINGKHIFMPYGFSASYWTNTLSEYVSEAIAWTFHSSGVEKKNCYRSVGDVGESKGNMVRPVKTK